MKFNIAAAAVAAMTAFALGSCSEGQYWTEPGNVGEVVAFAKPSVKVEVESDEEVPSSYDITVSRSEAGQELTVPVTFTTKTPDVLSGPESVTFAAGETTATYTVSISSLVPATTYGATISLDESTGLVHVDEDNLTFTFYICQNFNPEWSDAGTAELYSTDWVGDDVVESVKVEESPWPVAGERLFRLVDVYNVLEPAYADPGTEITFITDEAGNPLRTLESWYYIGEYDDPVDGDFYYFGGVGMYNGTSFTRSDNTYTMAGVIGYASELGGSVTAYTYETLVFDWACPAAE